MPSSNRRLKHRSKRCGCLQACNYYLLRCDSCHRGVHFDCLKLVAKPSVFVCKSCKNNGVEEARVADIRAAEGKPCAVVFHRTCHYHVGEVARGRKIRPEEEEHADEELKRSLCDICNSTCQFFDIVCDKCDVEWHAHCVDVTRELADRIDKWYCERCRNKDARLRITFKEGQDAEEDANVAVTPPPGPSREPTTPVQAAQRKKRPITSTEATTRPTKRPMNAAPLDAVPKAEQPLDATDATVEQPPKTEALAGAKASVEEQHVATVQPAVKTLAEQLKEAQARNTKLAEEKAALLREKTAAVSEKEDLQKALDEAKAEAAADRVKRTAVEGEMAQKDRVIARLTTRLLELNQL